MDGADSAAAHPGALMDLRCKHSPSRESERPDSGVIRAGVGAVLSRVSVMEDERDTYR